MKDKAAAPKRRKTVSWLRRGVQIFFFVLVALIATTGAIKELGVEQPFLLQGASLHAICPFGGVVSFWQLVTAGRFVSKIHEASVALAVIALVLSVLFGPVICGWVCPMGSIQEWFGAIGRKLFKKRYNNFVPRRLDKVLRYLRYATLIWVTWMTIVSGKLFFQEYDPYFALFNFWTHEVALTGVVILVVTLVLSLFVERPFCKYACPYGAFQGIFNLFRIFGIKRVAKTCIDCKACDRECPMNIKVSTAGTVRDHQCITCMKCSSEEACPVADTVVLAAGALPRMKVAAIGANEEAAE
ncbi:MAG: 4Fe-4S binding protein [Spirochaetes bacterium]|nr:4Fe-4S binding protein [Spirochaetota bacterium]